MWVYFAKNFPMSYLVKLEGKFIGMWQDIAVCVIGISIIGYIAYKVYRMFAAPKSKDPCCGCSGCSLKKELMK